MSRLISLHKVKLISTYENMMNDLYWLFLSVICLILSFIIGFLFSDSPLVLNSSFLTFCQAKSQSTLEFYKLVVFK